MSHVRRRLFARTAVKRKLKCCCAQGCGSHKRCTDGGTAAQQRRACILGSAACTSLNQYTSKTVRQAINSLQASDSRVDRVMLSIVL